MSKVGLVTILALFVPLASTGRPVAKKALSLHGGQMTITPKVCFRKVQLSHHKHALNQLGNVMQKRNPGAGLQETAPFERVYKDGNMMVSCIKDNMFYHGDKFGDHKHAYEIGSSKNVSIVHYAAVVPKEDQTEMTPTVCFDFCRTMPEMVYFGIQNGRECYCEPFFEAMAGDSSECDLNCPGDASQMCGGKTKSSIYEMHACNDSPLVLAAAAAEAHTFWLQLDELAGKAESAANGKQELAVNFQEKFGQAGDPDASNLMQTAKVAAGELLHAAEAAASFAEKLAGPVKEAAAMVALDLSSFEKKADDRGPLESVVADLINPEKSDFTTFAVAKKGDDLVAELKKSAKEAKKVVADLQALFLDNEPMVNSAFWVKEGPCITDDKGCVMSSNAAEGPYRNNEYCTIAATPGTKFSVETFALEPYGCRYDGLIVNGKTYCGEDGQESYGGGNIHDITSISGDVHFYTDSCCNNWGGGSLAGFKLCAEGGFTDSTRGNQYYPVMYFVDKEFTDVPMTCSGTVVGKPIYYKTYHLCAEACDTAIHDCVGFAYYPTGPNKPNLCFLFSDFKTGQYYTGCGSKAGFLQKHNTTKQDQPLEEEPTHPVCVAKLSKFVGTTLKPNPSGKCEQCMTKLTNAERCWE